MCKAGFAGDDAPRAVFRESTPLPELTDEIQLWAPSGSLTTGLVANHHFSFHCRPAPSSWVSIFRMLLAEILEGA
jgi:hypothetical protein